MNFNALVSGVSDDERIVTLAERLAKVHGPVQIRRESHGVHILMACPLCLEANGRRELRSKHLQLNAEKFLGIGAYALKFLPGNREAKKGYAQCMREHGPMSLNQILGWPPLAERGIDNILPSLVTDSAGKRYLIPDEKGVMIPDHPGTVIPITQLPQGHPALEYLANRPGGAYDPFWLREQFRAAWCTKEAPEGEEYSRWYRRHSEGWKSTPQGRIIFYSDVMNIQACWQGRYLEMEHPTGSYVWHPYREAWELRPPWAKGEEPVKYCTATGAARNAQLCGFDAVRRAAEARQEAQPACVLCEGPLDAARFPDRGMAILGKNLSEHQAALVGGFFRRAVLAFDADAPGADACERAAETLGLRGVRVCKFFTKAEEESDEKIDAGMLGYTACADRLNHLLTTF